MAEDGDSVRVSGTVVPADRRHRGAAGLMGGVDRPKLVELIERERERFAAEHVRSRELFDQAKRNLLGGVPMSWMSMWPGGHPIFAAEAQGSEITDADGNTYVDLCLGDTGAMAGHAPEATAEAVDARYRARRDDDAPDRGLGLGRGRARAPLRAAAVAADPDGDRRQPLRDPDGPPDHRPAEDLGLQLLLPRHRRRDVHRRRPRRARGLARGKRRPAGRSRPSRPRWSSSTTPTRWSACWPAARSRASSPSRR